MKSEENNDEKIKNTIKLLKNINNDFKIFSSKKLKYKTIWTNEEDRLLSHLTKIYGIKSWSKIARHFECKTPIQCSGRYRRIIPINKKGKWSNEEDNLLLNLMKTHGKNWSKITKHFLSRTGKQLRDRFINVLDSEINRNKFRAS